MSYDRTYDVDGMKLRAVGSGAKFSARAVARIATLIAQKGQWNGQQLIDAAAIRTSWDRRSAGRSRSIAAGGSTGGDTHRRSRRTRCSATAPVIKWCCVSPSLALVMVRLGELGVRLDGSSIGEPRAGSAVIANPMQNQDHGAILEDRLFRPLMQAVRRSLDSDQATSLTGGVATGAQSPRG